MNWVTLIAAGLVEVAWSQSIKPTDNFTRPLPSALCVLLGVTSVYLLSRAMQTLAVGTAYAVFTGIGATGAVVLGAVIFRDPLSPLRLASLGLIVTGVALAKLAG